MITIHVIGLGCMCQECLIERFEPTLAEQLLAKGRSGLWWGRFTISQEIPTKVQRKKWQLIARFLLCSPAVHLQAIFEDWGIDKIRKAANHAYQRSEKTFQPGTPSILVEGAGDDSSEEEDE